MQAPQWKEIEAVPTRFKTDDRACEAANKRAQKWRESEAAPTWFKNDYDRAAQAALQAELDQKAQKSERNEANDCDRRELAAQAGLNQKCGLYHGARMTVTSFWEKGSPEYRIVQDADRAIARTLRGFERSQFKIDPLDEGLYYVTRSGELIDKVTKEKAEEAHNINIQKARIEVQKKAEGMLAANGTIERSMAAVTAAHYRQIDLNTNTY